MEFVLRCNDLKCRLQLHDRAVVTTCSHVFCTSCADSTGLSRASSGHRICPACQAHLANPDDVVVAMLNPAEDYKTSVLSGLSPATIMECASRGLAFYTYQASQEIIYQEHLAKSLTEKCSSLNQGIETLLNEANTQIKALQDKMRAMYEEQAVLDQKLYDTNRAYAEKNKALQSTQRKYESLRAQVTATQVANAAGEEVDLTMHSIRQGDRFVDKIPGTRIGHVNFSQPGVDSQRGRERLHNRTGSGSSGSSGQQRSGGRTLFNSQIQHGGRTNTSRSAPNGTPHPPLNQHRRSQIPVVGGTRQGAFGIDNGPVYQVSPAMRQPFSASLNPRNTNFGLQGGTSRRSGMGNIAHLGQ